MTIEIKGKPIAELPKCKTKLVGDHLELDCASKPDADRMAELLAQEVIIRVKAFVVTEETK